MEEVPRTPSVGPNLGNDEERDRIFGRTSNRDDCIQWRFTMIMRARKCAILSLPYMNIFNDVVYFMGLKEIFLS